MLNADWGVEIQVQWRRAASRRDLCALDGAVEGALSAKGKSIVMRLLPAAEVKRLAGFLFLT